MDQLIAYVMVILSALTDGEAALVILDAADNYLLTRALALAVLWARVRVERVLWMALVAALDAGLGTIGPYVRVGCED